MHLKPFIIRTRRIHHTHTGGIEVATMRVPGGTLLLCVINTRKTYPVGRVMKCQWQRTLSSRARVCNWMSQFISNVSCTTQQQQQQKSRSQSRAQRPTWPYAMSSFQKKTSKCNTPAAFATARRDFRGRKHGIAQQSGEPCGKINYCSESRVHELAAGVCDLAINILAMCGHTRLGRFVRVLVRQRFAECRRSTTLLRAFMRPNAPGGHCVTHPEPVAI